MVVVLSQCDHIALRGDLEATAAAHFHVGALKLWQEQAFTWEDHNMKTIAMAVPHEHVACVADVDTVGEVGHPIASNLADKVTFVTEHYDTVALEIADVVLPATDGDVRGLSHVLAAVKP